MPNIYFDNNIYRLLKRDIESWQKFNNFCIDELQLSEFNVIFNWSQLLEDINLGKIISSIKKTDTWKKEIEDKKIFQTNNIDSINKSLDKYFGTICSIAQTIPELQREQLLQRIDKSIELAHYSTKDVISITLQKVRTFVGKTDYIEDLSFHIAWKCITSNQFISSNKQWGKRKNYLPSLIAVWYRLSDQTLDLYRLLERQYHSHTNYSQTSKFDSLDLDPLKPESDLCDSELIHYIAIGFEQHPVIGITFDSKYILEKRVSMFKQSLIDLNRDYKDCNIKTVPGKIICIDKDTFTRQDKKTNSHIINFDTPFQAQDTISSSII